jgi:hypothetical protein
LELHPAKPTRHPLFEICGEDRVFRPAWAEITGGNKLRITSSEIPAPVAARYAWSTEFAAVLFNSEKLPASPFRTDDYALESRHNR